MSAEDVSRRVQRSIVVYSILGMLTTSIVIAAVSLVPLYLHLKQDQEERLLLAVKTRSTLVQEYLHRILCVASHIASRSVVAEQLEGYSEGRLDLEELVELCTPRLEDAMRRSEDVAGIMQLDRYGRVLTRVGLAVPEKYVQIPGPGIREPFIVDPVSREGGAFLLSVSPIFDHRGGYIGTSLVLYKMSSLRRIIEDCTGLGISGELVLAYRLNETVRMILPVRGTGGASQEALPAGSPIAKALALGFGGANGLFFPEVSRLRPDAEIVAYGPVPGTDWAIAVKMYVEEVYAPVYEQVLYIIVSIFVLVVLNTVGIVVLLRPLTGKMIIHSDELMCQVHEKTAALQVELNERKQAEANLRESEERYSSLFENNHSVMLLVEPGSTQIIDANPAACRFYGYDRSEIKKKRIAEINLLPEEQVMQAARRATSGEQLVFQFRHRLSNGDIRDVEVYSGTIRVHGRQLLCSIVHDVTERRRIEEALEQLRWRNEVILSTAGEGIIGVDSAESMILANPMALKLVGWEESEIVGRSVHESIFRTGAYDSGLVDGGKCPVCAAFGDGLVKRSSDGLFCRKDGSRFPAEYVSTPFFEHGEVMGAVIVFCDITERKMAEAELRAAKELAEAASRSKSDFLASMSHEFRTPLNAIIGFTEMIADERFGELNSDQKEYLGDVLQSAYHLLGLINDVLDLAKVESGKMELRASEVDVRRWIEGSLVMIKEKAIAHRLTLMTDVSPEAGTIIADEQKLKQILYNLLSNAVKFTPDGGAIELRARRFSMGSLRERNDWEADLLLRSMGGMDAALSSDGAELLEVSVRDTGIGLKGDDLERIFNPFEQASSYLTRAYQGTGLGLALVRKLVMLHSGLIWAESEGEKHGSTFRLVLPTKPVDWADSIRLQHSYFQ